MDSKTCARLTRFMSALITCSEGIRTNLGSGGGEMLLSWIFC